MFKLPGDLRSSGGLADIKGGRAFGLFISADQMISPMKARLKKKK